MAVMHLRHITTIHVSCLAIDSFYLHTMVAYFCHHLSVIYVDLSDHYVDLSGKYPNDYKLNILFLNSVNARNCHLLVN